MGPEIVLTPGEIATELEASVSGLFLRAVYIPQADGSRRAEYWHHVADPADPADPEDPASDPAPAPPAARRA
jgi:hypothetical protein